MYPNVLKYSICNQYTIINEIFMVWGFFGTI